METVLKTVGPKTESYAGRVVVVGGGKSAQECVSLLLRSYMLIPVTGLTAVERCFTVLPPCLLVRGLK